MSNVINDNLVLTFSPKKNRLALNKESRWKMIWNRRFILYFPGFAGGKSESRKYEDRDNRNRNPFQRLWGGYCQSLGVIKPQHSIRSMVSRTLFRRYSSFARERLQIVYDAFLQFRPKEKAVTLRFYDPARPNFYPITNFANRPAEISARAIHARCAWRSESLPPESAQFIVDTRYGEIDNARDSFLRSLLPLAF